MRVADLDSDREQIFDSMFAGEMVVLGGEKRACTVRDTEGMMSP